MRIRTIKPSFFVDEELAEMPPLTRILFVGLWSLADRCGRLEDRPKRIKASVMPYDEHDIDTALECLRDAGFILRYTSDGKHVIQVTNFEKHQRLSGKEAETESELPAFQYVNRGSNGEAPGKHPGSNGEAPGCPGREGKGKEGNGVCGAEAPALAKVPGKPSSQEEVRDFFIEAKSNAIEADKFWDHFASNGWKVGGKSPMKDWQAAARNWLRNAPSFAPAPPHVNGRASPWQPPKAKSSVQQNLDHADAMIAKFENELNLPPFDSMQ
jgi:hypothetical protein